MNHETDSLNSIRTLTTIMVIAVILIVAFMILRPFILVILTAFILTLFLSPLYTRLVPYVKYRPLAALLSLSVFTIAVMLPIILIVSAAVSETASLVRFIQDKPDFFGDIQKSITGSLEQWGYVIDPGEIDIRDDILAVIRGFSSNLGSILARTGSLFIKTVFVYLTTYFLLMNKRSVRNFVINTRLVPMRYFSRIEQRSKELINGIVQGSLIVLFLQVLVSTTVFSIFGLPAPVLLGFIYGILALLPAIGPSLLWVPLSIILLISGDPLPALIFALILFSSNLAIDNYLGPRIIGSQTKLHQIIIMFSVFGGLSQFGILGIVLGPTIIALAMIALEMYKELLIGSSSNSIDDNHSL